jgi:Flp pilus assembly protein TadD
VEFRNVLAIAPQDADTHYAIGVLQKRLGRKAEAIAAFEGALALNPSHVGARNALAAERAPGGAGEAPAPQGP